MPLYSFSLDTEKGERLETAPFPDLPSARSHAVSKALEILWDNPYRLHARPEWGVRVEDEAGRRLLTVSLLQALANDIRTVDTIG